MGESKRRKAIDPNYGQPRFAIEILRLENSFATIHICDRVEQVQDQFLFHLFAKSRNMFAEIVLNEPQFHLKAWAAKNVDRLSPLVCKAVMDQVDILIVG